jgi:protein-tyrosine phosphatase
MESFLSHPLFIIIKKMFPEFSNWITHSGYLCGIDRTYVPVSETARPKTSVPKTTVPQTLVSRTSDVLQNQPLMRQGMPCQYDQLTELHSLFITTPQCKSSDNLDPIMPGLFISSKFEAENISLLKHHGITHIVNLSGEANKFEMLGFRYLKIDIMDDGDVVNILDLMEGIHRFMDQGLQTNGKVLVHCWAGVSRSATVILAYLVSRYKMSLPQSLRHVLGKHTIRPNDGFLKQLISYARQPSPLSLNARPPKC